ncbi:MAG: thioredoxin family protein [Pseudomonadota bacterium]
MRHLWTGIHGLPIICAIASVMAFATAAHAAVDPTKQVVPKTLTELVVIETPNCAYCRSFRKNLLPAYAASSRAKDVPIRFVTYKDVAKAGFSLREPIKILPTILVLDDGQEIGRIPGLTGHDLFFKSIQHILKSP